MFNKYPLTEWDPHALTTLAKRFLRESTATGRSNGFELWLQPSLCFLGLILSLFIYLFIPPLHHLQPFLEKQAGIKMFKIWLQNSTANDDTVALAKMILNSSACYFSSAILSKWSVKFLKKILLSKCVINLFWPYYWTGCSSKAGMSQYFIPLCRCTKNHKQQDQWCSLSQSWCHFGKRMTTINKSWIVKKGWVLI